jgi:ankyrin repeat protein
MDDEIVMIEKDLANIFVPGFMPPVSLMSSGDQESVKPLTISGLVNADEELMKWLLENGLDINTKDEDGKTPLMDAVSNLKPSTVKFLLEKGASINDTSNNGEDILSISRQTLNNEMISIIENINRTFKK